MKDIYPSTSYLGKHKPKKVDRTTGVSSRCNVIQINKGRQLCPTGPSGVSPL